MKENQHDADPPHELALSRLSRLEPARRVTALTMHTVSMRYTRHFLRRRAGNQRQGWGTWADYSRCAIGDIVLVCVPPFPMPFSQCFT